MDQVGPQATVHTVCSDWLQAEHSTNEGVLLGKSVRLMLMSSRDAVWWRATRCGFQDKDLNLGPPGSKESSVPLDHSPSVYESK